MLISLESAARPFVLAVIVFVVLLGSLPGTSTANPNDYVWEFGDGRTTYQPDPFQSTFDDHVGRSPVNTGVEQAHQYTFAGTLRDHMGTPIPGFPASQVELVILAPCQNPATLNPVAQSDQQGRMTWAPATMEQGGGSCESPGIVEIRVQGVAFKTLDSVTSPDQDGDGLVALNDLQTWQTAFVGQSPLYQGDLDFDGEIALGDLVRWQSHFVAR